MKDYKNYFLGLMSQADVETLELQIMSNDESEAELLQAENDLIEDYLDGKLKPKEMSAFNEKFLVTEERRARVRFVKTITDYAQNSAEKPVITQETKPSFFEQLNSVLSPRKFAFGFGSLALILTVGFISYLGWKNYSNYSSNSEISILLNKSFKNDRPTEARITGFDYAPKSEGTRGNADKSADLNLVSAKSRATEAVLKDETAENLHQLGRVLLAEKNFDEAIKQFEKSIKKNPNIAEIHNDLGVALMEKGKQKEEGKLELFAKANEEIEKSIELDKNLTAAFFNRGLVIESLSLPNQAKEAWENYLKIDSTSQWANEARQHLQKLETNKPVSKTKEEVLQEFLQAKQANDTEKAWQTLSRNREMITGKLIPQQLAFLFVDSKTNRDEATAKKALDALVYMGKLEEEKSGDLFWRDLARYYAEISPEKVPLLKKAHESLFNGFEQFIKRDFTKALSEFESSSQLFHQAGNELQKEISNNYITNCLGYSDNKSKEIDDRRVKIINQILKLSQERNYKWLELLGLLRITSIQNEATQYSSAIKNAERAYLIAKNSEDSYDEQRTLVMLASIYSQLGNKKKAINYTQKVWDKINDPDNSLRQKLREYFGMANLFVSVNNLNLAKLLAREETTLAEQIGETSLLSISQTHAGIIFAKNNNFIEARDFLTKGRQNAENLPTGKVQKNLVAYSLLKLADLEQETGNYEESARLYSESFKMNDSPYFELEIQKGRLRSFLATGNNNELERQIPKTIQIAEENRQKILEEEQSNGFFHNENTIFETAIEWEFERGNYEESYNYNEEASARSLLDLVKRSKKSVESNENPEVFAIAKPLKFAQIQPNIPENIQLLQYTVLDNKVLIWLVSKDKFIVKKVQMSSEDLQNKVEQFIRLTLEDKKEVSAETTQLSKEIFSILIKPIYQELDKDKQICLVPNKVLFFLPFSALLSEKGKLFLEEFVISYAPSANIFIHCTKNAAKKDSQSPETILSVGNPAFDMSAFSDLPNLEAAEGEAKSIARLYDESIILLDKTATKTAFQKDIEKVDVLHFAGHYLVKPELPSYSSLLFAKDGNDPEQSILTNRELSIESLKRLKLVVLSSCETGVESYLNGEGMIGLSRTFLALNIPLVVASQWKVDSGATAILMKEFHRLRREQKLPTAVALRQAQLEMLNDKEFKTPYYWSAFAVFGGYSKF